MLFLLRLASLRVRLYLSISSAKFSSKRRTRRSCDGSRSFEGSSSACNVRQRPNTATSSSKASVNLPKSSVLNCLDVEGSKKALYCDMPPLTGADIVSRNIVENSVN